MPGVVPFLPAIMGVAGMVDSNIQNKAAIKNNQNQQTAAVDRAKQAGQTATNQYNAFSNANPPPTGQTVTQPGAQNPSKNLISAIMASAGRQAPTPVAAPTPAAPPQPANPGILSALLG